MKIIVFSPTSTVFKMELSQPLGGADSTLLSMIETLASEHEVEAYIPVQREGQFYEMDEQTKFFVAPFMDLFQGQKECDVLILNRKVWAIPPNVKYKKLMFYSQDTNETPCFSGIKDKDYFKKFDRIIVLSDFHKKNFQEAFSVPDEKFFKLGNAADLMEKVEKEPLTFIYFSTPYRGLVVLMKMWKKIIAKYPTAKLHVFSSMKIYGAENLDELHFKAMLEGLERMEGVSSYGSRPHTEVMERLQKTFMLLYPNTYPETYCNVVMEARAAHTPFITTDKGALKETGNGGGAFIDGNPYTEEYQEKFLKTLDQIIEHPEIYAEMQKTCYPIRSWKDYAQDLLTEINRLNQEIKENA